MDATPFIYRSSRMKELIDYDPAASRRRFRRTSRPLTDREERYIANWDEAERRECGGLEAQHAECRRS